MITRVVVGARTISEPPAASAGLKAAPADARLFDSEKIYAKSQFKSAAL